MPVWFYNLLVYCVQLAILIAAGGLMVAVTRLREPGLRLVYWQVLLALGLLLPAVEPWQRAPQIGEEMEHAGESAAHAGRVGIVAAAAVPPHPAHVFSVYEIVAIVLVAGLLLRLLWLTVGITRLRRSRLHSSPLGPHSAADQFKAALNVSPAVLVSDRISSPVTFGWRRPRVLLPRKFIQMDEEQQRAILCHEFLHVQRRDWLWHVAEEVLRAAFWFHLAVAWLIAQIRLCREQVVDREVVLLAGSRRDYLDALFEIASSSSTTRHAPALLFLSERNLKRRVTLILKEVTMSRKKTVIALSASIGGLLLTCALVAGMLPLRTSAAQASSTFSLKTPLVRPDTHFYGNPGATVTVVEFGDFQCPACREAETVAEEVRKNLGGRVRFTYRQFPLTRFHHQAEKAAEAAECAADQGKFWQAVNYLSDHSLDFSSAGVQKFAVALGLDQARTIRCLSSGEMAARVQQDIRDGRTLGVHSVPTFFVGSKKIVGIPTYSQLNQLIEQELRANDDAQVAPPNGSNIPTGVYAANLSQEEYQQQLDEATKQAQAAQAAASKIDQKKIQEQIDQAMKQLKPAQMAEPKIDEAKLRQQIEQAMKQAKIAQEAASKIDQKKMQQQVEEAMKQLQKMNTPEMRQRMQEQMEQLKKMNTPEMRQQMEEAMKQLKMAQMAAPKIDEAQIRQQVDQAMQQAKIAQESAAKVNKAEMQRQLEQARKEVEQARKEAQDAREEARKARQDAMKARREAEEQRKDAKPAPSATPKPAPAPPKEITPPPAPPAPPAPPKTPGSAAIVGGVPGGVAGGVVGGAPGGISGGMIAVPHVPAPPSPAPKMAVPPAPPASPAPPPPQD